MPEEIRKPRLSRRRAAPVSGAASEGGAPPVDTRGGSTCGHSGCAQSCNVRYVGAVSHIRDHHAMHAAHGVGHIWAASIITGFAVVLTGVIAFQSAQAGTPAAVPANQQLAQVVQRLERLERLVSETRAACTGEDGDGSLDPNAGAPADSLLEEREMMRKQFLQGEGRADLSASSTGAYASTTRPDSMDEDVPAPKRK